ncbi:PQQ-dependent sugar dehydrogenase, partial [Balneolaceae bacterium]|nr:PQQ-dependent sugar dehydrogenase [Balneolaceae bacterium]
FYYMTTGGNIYRIDFNSGRQFLIANSGDYGINETQGFAISKLGEFFVSGTNKDGDNATNQGRVSRGSFIDNQLVWQDLLTTEEYPLSNTAFDHNFNGIVLSPDQKTLYVNSGSRTDHGEVHSVDGRYPNTREVALTAKLFQVPADTTDLILPNDYVFLEAKNFIYAEGLRNTFDLAFDKDGNLFGTENSGDRDDSEELNLIKEGKHYGFPWLMGGNLTPMQFVGYNVEEDPYVSTSSTAYRGGFFYNDPNYPSPPDSIDFVEGLINIGPDADRKRESDGNIYDASDNGLEIRTFTSHRSPLGLVFDTTSSLGGDYTNDGFVLGWTGSDHSGLLSRLSNQGKDMFHLSFIPDEKETFKVSVKRIATGFKNPIDAVIVDNKIYVMEYTGGWINNGSVGIYELTFPLSSTSLDFVSGPPSGISLDQNYPNPFNPTTKIQYELPISTEVNLSIYNGIGHKISELVNGEQRAGIHTVIYDAQNSSSGIYYYRLETPFSISIKKMILIK